MRIQLRQLGWILLFGIGTACSNEEHASTDNDQKESVVTVSFTLSMDHAAEEHTYCDNEVNPESVTVDIYRYDGEKGWTLLTDRVSCSCFVNTAHSYQYLAQVNRNIFGINPYGQNFRLTVTADTHETDIFTAEELTWDKDESVYVIPMCGIKSFTFNMSNNTLHVGNIHLLRAAVK